MKQRIVKRNKIKKGTYLYTSYNGFLDYLGTHLIVGIFLLPFMCIYWLLLLYFYMIKYLFIGIHNLIIQIINKLSNTNTSYDNNNK